MKRLALIIDDYLPSSTRVAAKMFHELACQYVAMGHEVTVITPAAGQSEKLVKETLDGVNVWRFSSGQMKDAGKVKRAINETLMSYRAWSAIKGELNSDTFDGVVYYSPSIFFGTLVKNIKKRCGCSAYLVLRDLFPQWAIDQKLIKAGSPIAKYFRFFELLSYRQADSIGLMSERNEDVFMRLNGEAYPTQILRNWASLQPWRRNTEDESIREKLNLNDKVIYFYGGNIGHAQDMANLMRLAKNMSEHPKAHFLFIGQGDEVELIQGLAKEWHLSNFTYLPAVDQDTFKRILSEVDVGLFSLAKNHTAHNFPGKLLGYMVQSLPILGSVNPGNDLMDIVNANNAGMITVNGEDEALLNHALELLSSEAVRSNVGQSGYELLCKEFSVETIAQSIITELERDYRQLSVQQV
ncbi:glycosyltransferase family 4 protein [Grimontia sp. NTOU-MAR1]|uniref:glycosyltransferase family 4 protein n=1 Tax=Grimontia sp. NTOU-MAR1 TaxID=3111011 RepID=UPI002DB641F8|nr:glycosyltransferase family 4 protein [Grimontia sp. NTOU-MAR1]WRV97525.1 glycosyltransferase family 4 protein [Grimontia sp. NTOU-MAR1]